MLSELSAEEDLMIHESFFKAVLEAGLQKVGPLHIWLIFLCFTDRVGDRKSFLRFEQELLECNVYN